jgi:hypothetical protein
MFNSEQLNELKKYEERSRRGGLDAKNGKEKKTLRSHRESQSGRTKAKMVLS